MFGHATTADKVQNAIEWTVKTGTYIGSELNNSIWMESKNGVQTRDEATNFTQCHSTTKCSFDVEKTRSEDLIRFGWDFFFLNGILSMFTEHHIALCWGL